MRVLVTGGAGFIGSHIVDALIERGHEVAVVDDLSTGTCENMNPKTRFYQLDICDKRIEEVLRREQPEIVSHHAAQVNVWKSTEDPIYDATESILGSLNLLENCVRLGVKKIIYASSGGAIYGEPEYLPVDEGHPIKPVSQYGVSKYAVEVYIQLYSLQRGLGYVILRYGNVYGPRQNPHAEAGVVAIFTKQMLYGEQPTIFGRGDKTRDYIHVSDIVEANILAMEYGRNGVYNIGTGVETSDHEVFDILAQALGYKGKSRYTPARRGEIYRIALDVTKPQRELGWRAKIPLIEGISSTVTYYKAQFESLSKPSLKVAGKSSRMKSFRLTYLK